MCSFWRPLSNLIWRALLDEIIAIFSGVSREDAIDETNVLVEDVLTDANASANLADSTNSTWRRIFIGPWL